jgi:hypothetical protein
MKIILTESQVQRLIEANTPLDNLNNTINAANYTYQFGWGESYILPSDVSLEGDISDDDITVRVTIEKVIYRGEDVTEFAINYGLWSGDSDSDTPLAFDFKNHIARLINSKVLRLVNQEISEYDVILEL